MFELGAHIYFIKYPEKNIEEFIAGLLPIYFSKKFSL